ncbi:hypothetical protein CSAL01_08573 [Colletotrichum salicis]|uniref:Uncharacterized protein n=1 Tax=Colletotrichum salicis TaxID=1209931 RepID=A0A135V7U3_9PEZI|nr:hypothetical protein CSAL01_08573 [Colletotrichum salicis]
MQHPLKGTSNTVHRPYTVQLPESPTPRPTSLREPGTQLASPRTPLSHLAAVRYHRLARIASTTTGTKFTNNSTGLQATPKPGLACHLYSPLPPVFALWYCTHLGKLSHRPNPDRPDTRPKPSPRMRQQAKTSLDYLIRPAQALSTES